MALPALSETPDNELIYTLPAIVITPESHETDLQHVPSTVNSLMGEQLDAVGIKHTQELPYTIPGLVFKSSAGMGEPYLRGVGGSVSVAGDSGVATFIDNVWLSRAAQSLRDLYDVDRVEVIKGPDGVHLGRNVMGGAISITTRDPGPYHDAYMDILYGTSNRRQLRGAANVPIPDSDISLRFAGSWHRRDGYSRNLFRNEELDDQDNYAWRGKLRFRPTTVLDIIFSSEHTRQDDTRGLAKQPDRNTGVNGGILLGGTVPDNPREVMHNVDEYQNIKSDIYSVRAVWKEEELELQSTTAYQKIDLNMAYELDATEVDYSSSFPVMNTHSLSQEFRLSSRKDKSFTWVAGLFLMHEDSSQSQSSHLPLVSFQNNSASITKNMAYALFGELSYLFAPQWQARAGLRYNYDKRKLDLENTIIDPFGVIGASGITTARYSAQNSWEAFTPELGLTFSPDKDLLYYVNASRGFKSGGYNAYSIQPSFDPEYLWMYEAGVKVTLPATRIRLNGALFHYNYKDIQLLTLPSTSPPGTLPIVANAARATIQGVDLQAWFMPARSLELSAGVTLLDAQFDEFDSIDPNNPANNPDRSGGALPQAPKVSVILGAEYRHALSHSCDLRMTVNYKYQSRVYFNPYQDRAVLQEGYSLLNASLGIDNYNNGWYAELYANNINDELYAQNIIRIDPVVGTARFWGEPRTFGIRVGARL